MKGSVGLIIAAALGIVGAFVNWWYIDQKSREFEVVEFLAVGKDVSIRRGDAFRDSHFTRVRVPLTAAGKPGDGKLRDTAVPYSDMRTVLGMKANRNFGEGELLLRQDLKTPPPELNIGPNERVVWIPVDTRSFVPSLVNPGAEVSFVVYKTNLPGSVVAPPPMGSEEDPDGQPQPVPAGDSETVGPFEVISLGNRLGTSEVHKAAGLPQTQENVMGIRVPVVNGDLDAKAKRLLKMLQFSSVRYAGVVLHPPRKT
jgi:hypothetical protein